MVPSSFSSLSTCYAIGGFTIISLLSVSVVVCFGSCDAMNPLQMHVVQGYYIVRKRAFVGGIVRLSSMVIRRYASLEKMFSIYERSYNSV